MRSQAKGARSLEKNGQEEEIREFKQIKNWLMLLIFKKRQEMISHRDAQEAMSETLGSVLYSLPKCCVGGLAC